MKWGYSACKRCGVEKKEQFIKDEFCGECLNKIKRGSGCQSD